MAYSKSLRLFKMIWIRAH